MTSCRSKDQSFILWLLPQEYQPYWLLATASTSRSLMASPMRDLALYIVTSRRTSSSFSYGFSCKSSSLLLLWLLAVRVPVLRYYCDFPLCEFQSFGINVTLAVRVPVVQYDLSPCEFQSINMTSCYASSSQSIWPLAMRVPVSFFISPAGVFSPKTLLLASLTRVFSRRSKSEDFIIWPLQQELCQRSSRMAI